ncbi:hypothetical protein CfE428DRAFT_0189 [Chthoniobacter flavus Ellin428]|uniref:Uncharacterized protein n=1 Tax=Chthoniobacter flavus Ellin428 TaxID=497964 RepID=B4CU26_9BACT|nr:hypothetical protein [Chthoniobacter flavus]EDY22064.1 hypothetical protein CfE428DRAFT_0189 [Chthoniobacter flavus Ellin428]TCO94899.1 hypothetical protein EV701_102371 [Chthoniobacter flavus]
MNGRKEAQKAQKQIFAEYASFTRRVSMNATHWAEEHFPFVPFVPFCGHSQSRF